MRTLQHVVIGRMDIALLDDAHGLFLVLVKEVEQELFVRKVECIDGLLVLVLMEDIAIRVVVRPLDVIDVLDALDVHRETLEAVRDFRCDRAHILAADLLEIRELCDLHAVEPDFPAKAPGTERRRLPVVLDEADVVLLRVDAEALEALEVELLDVVRRRLHDDLELMVLIETVRVVAIAAIGRSPRRLDIRDMPRLRAEHAQERRRVHRAGALLHVIRLAENAALLMPELLQRQDDFLKFHWDISSFKNAQAGCCRPQRTCHRHEKSPVPATKMSQGRDL